MKYEIHDSHGAPQCGCEIVKFDSNWDMDDYLEEHPDVYERIKEGYATVVEVPTIEKFALVFVVKECDGSTTETVVAVGECDSDMHEAFEEMPWSRFVHYESRPWNGEKVGDVTMK